MQFLILMLQVLNGTTKALVWRLKSTVKRMTLTLRQLSSPPEGLYQITKFYPLSFRIDIKNFTLQDQA